MDKGIRLNVNAKFAQLLAERNAKPADDKTRNKVFRRDVMLWAMDEFNCTIAAAATHYNHALKKFQTEHPEQVEGLGRPEDKKGGRKRKVVDKLLETVRAAGDADEGATAEDLVTPELFVVKKKKDGATVAEGLSFDAAKELCYKAQSAKKAALYWIAA